MAATVRLGSLIEAIAKAVAHAQDQVERHQVRNLMRYFKADGQPITLPLRMPSHKEEDYHVPILGLVPLSALKIKEATVKLSVDMGELVEEDVPETPEDENPTDAKATKDLSAIRKVKTVHSLNISTATGRSGGKIQITLNLQDCEVPEGAQRMVDYLNKMQGIHPKAAAKDEAT